MKKYNAILRDLHEGLMLLPTNASGKALWKKHHRAEMKKWMPVDRLEKKAKRADYLATLAHEGKNYYVLWQRDCDMAEWTAVVALPAGVAAYEAKLESLNEWADGPFSLQPATKLEADAFEPHHRDRAMEAYEDGRGNAHIV